MKKISVRYKKIVASYVLGLIIFGMFCVGMFVPAVKAEVVVKKQHGGCHHRSMALATKDNWQNQEPNCCWNRPYKNQAIINDRQNVNHRSLWAVLPLCDFQPVAESCGLKATADVWPPPDIALLRSVIKKE